VFDTRDRADPGTHEPRRAVTLQSMSAGTKPTNRTPRARPNMGHTRRRVCPATPSGASSIIRHHESGDPRQLVTPVRQIHLAKVAIVLPSGAFPHDEAIREPAMTGNH